MSNLTVNKKQIPSALQDYCLENQKNYIRTSSFDAHLTSAIGFFSGILGNICKVQLKNEYSVYPNLYSYIIGASGGGKTAYLRPGISQFSDIEGAKERAFSIEQKKRITEQKKLKEENIERKKAGLDLIPAKVEENYPAGVFNCQYPLFTMDFTIEGMQEDMAKRTLGNAFIVRDELGGMFKTFQRVGRQNDIPFLIEAYESVSKTYRITRKMEEAKIPVIYNICANILGGIQFDLLNKQIDSYISAGERDGFYARFQNLTILPDKDEEQTSYPRDKDKIAAFENLIDEITEERVNHSKIKTHLHTPKIFKLSEEAEYYYLRFFHTLKDEQHDNLLYHEHLQKTATFALKIALIFHILWKPKGISFENYETIIDLDTLQEAIKYAKSKLEFAKTLYRVNQLEIRNTELLANELYNYLFSKKHKFYSKYKQRLWTVRDLSRTENKILPRKNNKAIDKERLSDLLDYLVEQNKISSIESLLPNKQIIMKYSFSIPDVAEKSTINTSNNYELSESETLNRSTYFSKSELKEHSDILKGRVKLIDFLKQSMSFKNNMAKCPFHDDSTASFSVKNDFYHCFGCNAGGDIFSYLQAKQGMDFARAVKYLESYTGTPPLINLESSPNNHFEALPSQVVSTNNLIDSKKQKEVEELERRKRIDYAESIYKLSKPVNNSSFLYFQNRIGLHSYKDIADSIEQLRVIKSHLHSESKESMPTMVWAIRELESLNICGVHLTYLTKDLSSKANISNNKKINGTFKGGVIKLKINPGLNSSSNLIIAEGIETALSAFILRKFKELRDDFDVFAAVNAANLINLNVLTLKQKYSRIIIAADNDEVGKKYANQLKEKLTLIGVNTELILPNDGFKDFNDQLKGAR